MYGTVSIEELTRNSFKFKLTKDAVNLNTLNPFKMEFGDIYGNIWYTSGEITTVATTTLTVGPLTFGSSTAFMPGATYKVKVKCTVGGSLVEFGSVNFQGPEGIAPPLTAITPLSPTIRNQIIYGNCVAMTLATAMDVGKMKSYGSEFENYSASYIYGNGLAGADESGMPFVGTISQVMVDGSPRVDIANNKASIPLDTMSVADSVTLHNNIPAYAAQNALKQKFVTPEAFDFYDAAKIHSYLQTYGCVAIAFCYPYGFNSLSGPSSIMPPPTNGYEGVHAALITGATVISGKLHWIVQNSWGTGWGDGGKFYIPWDYGRNSTYTANYWIYEAAKVPMTVSNTHPSEVTNVQGTKISATQATITWQSSNPAGTYYLVLAATSGSNQYWFKGRTTNKSLLINLDQERPYDIKVIAEDTSYRYSKGTVATYVHGVGFQWSFPVNVGEEIKITAAEYNALIDLMAIKWPFSYSFINNYVYKVVAGAVIDSFDVRDLLRAIEMIATNYYVSYPSYPQWNDIILAQNWINIANNYNALP